jgi:hypothetical protein
MSGPFNTNASGINSSGQIVGSFGDIHPVNSRLGNFRPAKKIQRSHFLARRAIREIVIVTIRFTRAGYVEAMGMRLLAGRDFQPTHHDGVYEALIDQHLAAQFFPKGSPIGVTLQIFGEGPNHELFPRIVGVVDQARLHGLYQDGRPQVFIRAEDTGSRGYWFFAVRTNGDPHALISQTRSAIRQIERRIPVSQMWTMEEIVGNARSRERISAVMLSGLALGALLLATMGLFGMISGSVTRRRGELAVRLALGATHHRVIRLVVGEGAHAGDRSADGDSWDHLAGEALRGFLIGVSPFDASTLAAVALGLIGISLLACYLAATRVTTIDPERLLREGYPYWRASYCSTLALGGDNWGQSRS